METLQFTKAQSRSLSNYKRMGIDIEVLDSELIKITQSRLINGYVLNQKQLVERAKEVFPDAKVIPVVFSLDVDSITVEWIEGKMKEFGISRNDLIKQLAIDKSSLSLYFSGKRGLDKSQRAAFYFYFLTYELNRDFRDDSEHSIISKSILELDPIAKPKEESIETQLKNAKERIKILQSLGNKLRRDFNK